MKLTEAEMRMVFQIESTNQNAALNEIYMTWRYAPNPATKETAEGLLDKLRPLSDQECMDLIRKVQAEYRLPEKARTIGEMLAEARQRSGAQKLSGHDIMALERFDPATRHMIVFDTGQNYLKSLFALAFQAFLIMVCVGIYSVLVQSIATDGNISGAIWACMGYTVLLCFALFKTGSLSKSLFGAH